MTDDQPQSLNERLDRLEASNARIEKEIAAVARLQESLDRWADAHEASTSALLQVHARLESLGHSMGNAVAKRLVRELRPKH